MRSIIRSGLVAAMIVACSATLARAGDEDEIRASGKAFIEALYKGDAATVKKHALFTEDQGKMVDALTDTVHAQKELVDAAVAKFGDAGKEILPGQMLNRTPNWEGLLKDAKVEITGDTAIVTTEKNQGRPAKFKKDDGKWKVDLTEMFKQPDQTRNVAAAAAMMEKRSKVMSETAGEIKDGKYSTVQEARAALFQKMRDAFGAGRGQRPGAQPGGGNQ